MEVLSSSSVGLSQQDVPVDLTKGNHHSQTLFPSYNFDTSIHETSFPHLRLTGRVSSVVRKAVQGHSYPVSTENVGKTNQNEGIYSPQKEFAPLPKKKRLLEVDSSLDLHLEKKARVEYDTHFSQNMPLTPNFDTKDYNAIKSRLYFPHSFIDKPEEMFHLSPHLNYPLSTYGMDNHALMGRLLNPHCVDGSTESIKETENLLAAVQHSQMLYYTYCTQLLQNLQTRRLLQEQEQLRKCPEFPLKPVGQTFNKLEDGGEQSEKEVSSTNQGIGNFSKSPSKQTEKDFSSLGSPTNPDYSKAMSPGHSWSAKKTPLENYTLEPCSSVEPGISSGRSHVLPGMHQGVHGSPSTLPGTPHITHGATHGISHTIPSNSHPLNDATPHTMPVDLHIMHPRKRAPRALTGKHVRPGTGASPSTLLTLRHKLAQKLKSKQEKGKLEKHIALGGKSDRSRGKKR